MISGLSALLFGFADLRYNLIGRCRKKWRGSDKPETTIEEKDICDLGNVRGTVTLDLRKGNYFRFTPKEHIILRFKNPPPSGKVGEFQFEIIDEGKCTVSWQGPINFYPRNEAPSLKLGVNIFVGQTSDGGLSWRVFSLGGC